MTLFRLVLCVLPSVSFLAVNQITHSSLLSDPSVSEVHVSLPVQMCVISLKLGDHSQNRPKTVNVPPGFT